MDEDIWSCEITCPTVRNGEAEFRLEAGLPPRGPWDPDNPPSEEGVAWSKIGYDPEWFTEGEFTIRFKLTERPTENAVWWGLALWDPGPAEDMSQFNEINFGYTTDQSFENTELRFESARLGEDVSLRVDTGVDLYDGEWHTGTLKYTSEYVQFYLNGELLETINDQNVIPTDPMQLIVGPRLVSGDPLEEDFVQTVDYVWIAD